MKSIISKKWYGVPVIVFALVALLGVGAITWAATSFTFHGTGNVVATGGGGGGGGGVLTYDFVVGSDTSAGTAVTDAFFALNDINRGGVYTKTVYLKKTGTAPTFNVAVTIANLSTGLTVAPIAPVTLTAAEATTPVAVPIIITVATDTPFGPVTYDPSFALVP